MNVIKKNIGSIVLSVYMVLGAFLYNLEETSVVLICLVVLAVCWFLWKVIKHEFSFSLNVRSYWADIKVIVAFFLYEVFLLVYNTFLANLDNEIYNWCMLAFLHCFLWVYVKKSKENLAGIFDGIIYAGIVVMGVMLFAYAGNENEIVWIANLISDKAVVASWALLFSIVGVLSYCFCEDRIKSLFYLFAIVLSFLILCINHYCISFWLLLFGFLLIPIVFRPMAELIKRDMQMLFVFLFMLSNLSLVTNYTDFLLVDITLSLESSVYLEMLLAIGGVIFFTYWDRLPEDVDLNKVSMLKLQRVFIHALCLLVLAFVGIIFGGNSWYDLPDTMTGELVKSAVVPVLREVAQNRSGLSVMIEYQGIIGTAFFLLLVYLVLKKTMGNYHMDKQMVTSCMLVWFLFLGQMLFLTPSINVMPIYFSMFLYSAYMPEKEKEVIIMKKQRYGGEEL